MQFRSVRRWAGTQSQRAPPSIPRAAQRRGLEARARLAAGAAAAQTGFCGARCRRRVGGPLSAAITFRHRKWPAPLREASASSDQRSVVPPGLAVQTP